MDLCSSDAVAVCAFAVDYASVAAFLCVAGAACAAACRSPDLQIRPRATWPRPQSNPCANSHDANAVLRAVGRRLGIARPGVTVTSPFRQCRERDWDLSASDRNFVAAKERLSS